MKNEYAEAVASRIIEQLQQGTAPWQKPWGPGELQLPYNPTTGKAYRGVNSLWLYAQGCDDPRWMTYNQAANADAQVRKGSKGTQIIYWKFSEEQKATDEQGRPIIDSTTGKQKTITVKLARPRSFMAVVFNASQIDGLPPLEEKITNSEQNAERNARAETILTHSGANIFHQHGDRAFYHPSTDKIILPERNQFSNLDSYYAVAMHELGHWTGHSSRLNRDLLHPFGSEGYAREELRAEIASLMVGERLGIGHDPSQHVAYVGSWIKVLQKDPREIFRAASDAERITEYLMGFEQEQVIEQQSESEFEQPQFIQHESQENSMSLRTYLAVPYLEKNEAKARGAKWDKDAKAWYAPSGIDMTTSGLEKWSIDKANVISSAESQPAIEQFRNALREMGLKLSDDIITDGKIQRLAVDGDKSSAKSGAYAYHEMGKRPSGFIQNHKTGEKMYWKPEGRVQSLTTDEWNRQVFEAREQRTAREADQQLGYEATAAAAFALWSEAPAASSDHPYCKEKGITYSENLRIVPDNVSLEAEKHGIRIAKTAQEVKELREADSRHRVFKAGDLLIPGIDNTGKLWTLQSVNPYFKSFMKGGKKAGIYSLAGAGNPHKMLAKDQHFPLIIAEGYATADTISRLLNGKPTIVAFDCGNLDAVARELRKENSLRPLLIAADNDHHALKMNVGLVKANHAAKTNGGHVLIPQFKDGEKGSDWNDLAANHGDESARQMLTKQMEAAKYNVIMPTEQLTHRAHRSLSKQSNNISSHDIADSL